MNQRKIWSMGLLCLLAGSCAITTTTTNQSGSLPTERPCPEVSPAVFEVCGCPLHEVSLYTWARPFGLLADPGFKKKIDLCRTTVTQKPAMVACLQKQFPGHDPAFISSFAEVVLRSKPDPETEAMYNACVTRVTQPKR